MHVKVAIAVWAKVTDLTRMLPRAAKAGCVLMASPGFKLRRSQALSTRGFFGISIRRVAGLSINLVNTGPINPGKHAIPLRGRPDGPVRVVGLFRFGLHPEDLNGRLGPGETAEDPGLTMIAGVSRPVAFSLFKNWPRKGRCTAGRENYRGDLESPAKAMKRATMSARQAERCNGFIRRASSWPGLEVPSAARPPSARPPHLRLSAKNFRMSEPADRRRKRPPAASLNTRPTTRRTGI